MTLAGENGEELHLVHVHILAVTGVQGYPFVQARTGHRDTPTGRQRRLRGAIFR